MKNIPTWERALRVGAGVALLGFGLLEFPGSWTGYHFAIAGVIAGLTGFVGFCPACALFGRKLRS